MEQTHNGLLPVLAMSSRAVDYEFLVAGLAGLSDITVSADNGHMTITAAAPAAPTAPPARSDSRTLTVVPAAFGALPTPTLVALHLSGHHPVTFTTEEFKDADPGDPPHADVIAALTSQQAALHSPGKVRTGTDEMITKNRQSSLTRAVVDQLDVLIGFLGVPATPGEAPGNADHVQLQAPRAAASVEQAHHIGEKARVIRDAR